MTRREEQRLWRLINNPPAGSKLEAARQYGLDLTLNLESLRMTPDQRVKHMERALRLVEELRRAGCAQPV